MAFTLPGESVDKVLGVSNFHLSRTARAFIIERTVGGDDGNWNNRGDEGAKRNDPPLTNPPSGFENILDLSERPKDERLEHLGEYALAA